MKTSSLLTAMLLGATCGLSLGRRKTRNRFDFKERCVVITGGSRGLGLVMARQLAREGARLAIIARDPTELKLAEEQLAPLGAEVFTLSCDVRDQLDVNDAIHQIVARFGRIDVLINNAGLIQVGPMEHMTIRDFESALAIHLFAPLYCVLAVLSHMRLAGHGRIVNIASVGGKIAVPHLLAYCASKFALVGLSDGLRAELRRHHILVTTVCPGLMRTGSPPHASFKGKHRREYAWFAISDSLPLLSMSAERAARLILTACRRGAPRVVLGISTKSAILFNELFPGAMSQLLSGANRLLPGPAAQPNPRAYAGFESHSSLAPSWLTAATENAARRNNELSPATGLES